MITQIHSRVTWDIRHWWTCPRKTWLLEAAQFIVFKNSRCCRLQKRIRASGRRNMWGCLFFSEKKILFCSRQSSSITQHFLFPTASATPNRLPRRDTEAFKTMDAATPHVRFNRLLNCWILYWWVCLFFCIDVKNRTGYPNMVPNIFQWKCLHFPVLYEVLPVQHAFISISISCLHS